MRIYGFIIFGIGVVLNMIGGCIAMIRNPSAFNNQSRANFDPVRKDIPDAAIGSWGRAQWNDAKGKWFTRIGMGMAVVGMLLILMLGHWSSAGEQPWKLSITKQIVTSPRDQK